MYFKYFTSEKPISNGFYNKNELKGISTLKKIKPLFLRYKGDSNNFIINIGKGVYTKYLQVIIFIITNHRKRILLYKLMNNDFYNKKDKQDFLQYTCIENDFYHENTLQIYFSIKMYCW